MELVSEFMELFTGLARAHGVSEPAPAIPGEKVKGKTYTLQEPLTPEKFEAHLLGVRGVGVVPVMDDGRLRFAAIDIDVIGIDLAKLEQDCKDKGLPLVVCRSKSGGAHCYLFLSEPEAASTIIAALKKWSTELGYGGCEVFPKQPRLSVEHANVGNWINLPYFAAATTNRYAIRDGVPLSFKDFIAYGFERRTTWLDYNRSCTSDTLHEAPPCLVELAKQGIGEGARNNALFNFAVYARLRYDSAADTKSDWETEVKHMNETYFSPPLLPTEVREVLKSSRRKTYFYTCNQPPIKQVCKKDVCKTCAFGIGAFESAPDIVLEQIIKIMSDPPTWVAVVDGEKLELTTDDLLQQGRFRKICLERINKIPKALSAPVWEKHVAEKLQTLTIVDAPKDAGTEGQFMAHVEAFCTGRAQARTQDELLQGKPWCDNGRVYFRSPDLHKYLAQQHFRDVTKHKAWQVVQKFGGESITTVLKGRKVQLWSLPEFDRQTTSFDVPKVTGAF